MRLILFALLSNPVFAASIVEVPSGNLRVFWNTVKNAGTAASVKIDMFSAHAAPVTNAEYLEFLRAKKEWRKSRVPKLFADANYLKDFKSDLALSKGVHLDGPVVNVSYFAAQAYCEHLGMELPTTAQWEYMAAASETKADANKDPEFLDRILEWYSEPNTNAPLSAVKMGKPNVYGVYDLHGLIWEWVSDFNSSTATGESREDGSLNRDLFCGAGGMGDGDKENYAAYMRFAFRSSLKGKSTAWNLGFRCVKGA